MGQRTFLSVSAAHSFAKTVASNTRFSSLVRREGETWIVSGRGVVDQLEEVSNTRNLAAFREKISAARELLEHGTDLTQIQGLLEELSAFLAIHTMNISLGEADQLFWINIPKTYEAVRDLSDLIEDVPLVKSMEHAHELAYNLADVAGRLAPFKLSQRALKEAKDLAAKAKVLPSESAAILARAVRKLTTDPGNCSCGRGSWTLREGPYGYFFGCTDFPNCFRTRRLTPHEAVILEA